jgi:hypothetical protein
MRWLIVILGATGLLGGLALGLAPRLKRATLRVAIQTRDGNAEDEARLAGVALALEERDGRAGGWRLATAHQTVGADGILRVPRPPAHTLLYAVQPPLDLRDGAGTLLMGVDGAEEAVLVAAWARSRGLARLEELPPFRTSSPVGPAPKKGAAGRPRRAPPDLAPLAAELLAKAPDAVTLLTAPRWLLVDGYAEIRRAGFGGPVFIPGHILTERTLGSLEGARVALAPLRLPPSGFPHPHPFAYAAYRGTLAYVDTLSENIYLDPLEQARTQPSAFLSLSDEAAIYELRNGRLELSK